MNQMNELNIVTGYISVKSILDAKSRTIHKIILDKTRYDKIMSSKYHKAEKIQYAILKNSGLNIEYVSQAEFGNYTESAVSGGILAIVGERKYQTIDDEISNIENKYFTILDGIEDPYNFGYAVRSLYAAGVDVLIIPDREYYHSVETIVRASAGAFERIKCCITHNLYGTCNMLRNRGVSLIATAKSKASKDLNSVDIHAPVCLIYGGERRGISKEILGICDSVIKIEYFRDCDYSLPAVSAISILSFEIGDKLKR